MIVYHFINAKFGLKAIRERRLKVSDLDGVNDLFDFLSVAAPTKQDRKILKEWRREMAQDIGLICFSRNWHSPVQWAHYADRHGGLCLGFDIPNENLGQVNYVRSRPAWPTTKRLPEDWSKDEESKIIHQLLYTKYAHWSYEDEYRLFTTRRSQESDGQYYVNFYEELKLVRVLVGARSKLTRADLRAALGDIGPQVETFKVRPAFETFSIVRQRDESQWR